MMAFILIESLLYLVGHYYAPVVSIICRYKWIIKKINGLQYEIILKFTLINLEWRSVLSRINDDIFPLDREPREKKAHTLDDEGSFQEKTNYIQEKQYTSTQYFICCCLILNLFVRYSF